MDNAGIRWKIGEDFRRGEDFEFAMKKEYLMILTILYVSNAKNS